MTFDLDVILAAHGAGNGSSANALVHACARQLEITAVGARVTAAFHHGEPTFAAALLAADRPRRLVVPILTEDGYYAERLRRETARAFVTGTETVVLAPVGTHQSVIQALADRAADAVVQRDWAVSDTMIVVVGHGTARHAGGGAAARAVADAVAQRDGLTAHAAYLDQAPSIEDVIDLARPGGSLVIVPFLLGGGVHATDDVPARVTAVAARRGVPLHRIVFLEPMGGLPALSELIDRVVRDARGDRLRLNVGARASLLSSRQVELFAACMARYGVDIRFVLCDTPGDGDQSTRIHGFGIDDPYTGEINDALRAGRIDVAVHSLKDLPVIDDPAIVDAAVLARGSVADVLVSRSGARHSALPHGARIETSYARRASQLRRARPDVVPVPIRGTGPARIDAVDRGDVDAVVLATAGLEHLGLHRRIADRLSLEQFVPAPAQGAIVVQCRKDSPLLPLLQQSDDRAARLDVRSERVFARAVGQRDDRVAGSHATVDGGRVVLYGRIIDPVSARACDVSITGDDPDLVGLSASEALSALRAREERTGVPT